MWGKINHYCWYNDDFGCLKNYDKMFARKFDENTEIEIINRIFDLIKNSSVY